MSVSNFQFSYISTDASLFQDVLDLRYKTFFEPFLLNRSMVEDENEATSDHLIAKGTDNTILGYVRITIQNGEAVISQMVVDVSKRKKGIGRSLVEKVIEKVKGEGVTKMVVNSRLNALKFYEKLGFRSVGEVFSSRKTNLLYMKMEKMLN